MELLLCREAMGRLDNRVEQVRADRANARNLLEFVDLPVGLAEFYQFPPGLSFFLMRLVEKPVETLNLSADPVVR